MYLRLRGENPVMSGNTARKSCASRSITFALRSLPRQDVASDLPVQQHQFSVDRQRGALLDGVDAAFEIDQPVGIAVRCRGQAGGRGVHALFRCVEGVRCADQSLHRSGIGASSRGRFCDAGSSQRVEVRCRARRRRRSIADRRRSSPAPIAPRGPSSRQASRGKCVRSHRERSCRPSSLTGVAAVRNPIR